jgi:NAD-dependent DNA ligase
LIIKILLKIKEKDIRIHDIIHVVRNGDVIPGISYSLELLSLFVLSK